MHPWRMGIFAFGVLLVTGSAIAQSHSLVRLEAVKPLRCAASKLHSADQVRCFVWATTRTSGAIDRAEARCTNPEFTSAAEKCLNAHRLKKEFRGAEAQVCVEISYLFSEPVKRGNMTSKILVSSTRELSDCEMSIAPTATWK